MPISTRKIAGILGSLTGFAVLALVSASPLSAVQPVPLPNPRSGADTSGHHVDVDFTFYVGGFLVAQGHSAARFDGTRYHAQTDISTVGMTRALYEATFKLASEGGIDEARLAPASFVSDSWDKKVTRKVTLSYDPSGMPTLSAVPPYDDNDLKEVPADKKIGTQDPVSSLIIPVVANADPCNRTIPVFDGRRRYDLKLTNRGPVQMTPRGLGHPVTAFLCTIKYIPVAPIETKKVTEMLRKNDEAKVWLAPFDNGRIYMPVRFEIKTPLGGAVMELTNTQEYSQNGPRPAIQ